MWSPTDHKDGVIEIVSLTSDFTRSDRGSKLIIFLAALKWLKAFLEEIEGIYAHGAEPQSCGGIF